ncbi:MAG: response regulator [Rhodobacteraceae bacterium]|nr:response regulator [Paracoccaceae bacterium]
MRILAVDDEPLILRLLETTLEGLNYSDNTFVQSAAEALNSINDAPQPFDCILLDIRMPEVDGIELLRQIRQLPVYRNTPIIMLTALAEKEFIDESFASGATDYLNKPIDATDLNARLRVANLLSQADAARQAAQIQSSVAGQLSPQVRETFDISEAIQINDVPRVVGALAMENYLLQLGRLGMFKLGAIGFQIRGAGGIYASVGPTEFREILTDVADCIFEATRSVNPLISYLGSGSFIAIVPRTHSFDREELEDNITTYLNRYRPEEFLSSEKEVRVLAGEQTNGSLFGASPLKIIDQAMNSVHERQSYAPSNLTSHLIAI